MLNANNEDILNLFAFQWRNSELYQKWCNLMGVNKLQDVKTVNEIPFMPIESFRNHKIYTESTEPQLVFSSSGTTQNQTSKHYVAYHEIYEQAFLEGFNHFYGKPKDWSIFALLPQYLERQESSLAYMVQKLHSRNPANGGFFLYNHYQLNTELQTAIDDNQKVMLIGVTFALVEFAENFSCKLSPDSVVMETGGMKGKRKEIERTELHKLLKKCFNVNQIHSEYGMTELLSQAYSNGNGLFKPSPSMRVIGRALDNPLRIGVVNKVAGLNIIDMANKYSCPFIATADQGIVYPNGDFEVHGRIKNEILRGCNMLA